MKAAWLIKKEMRLFSKMDEEIDGLFLELSEIMQPKPLERLKRVLGRLYIKINELTASRDLWKSKYQAIRSESNKAIRE